MRKFVKGCLITAVIMVFVGFICVSASVATGGITQTERMIENGELSFGVTEGVDHDTVRAVDNVQPAEKADTEVAIERIDGISYEGEFSNDHIAARDVRKLDIDIEGGYLVIENSEDSQFHLEASEGKYSKVQYYLEGDTLHLSKRYSLTDYVKYDNDHILTLAVPTTCSLYEVDIDLGAGEMEISDLQISGSMDIDVGAGTVSADNVSAYELNIDVGAGEAIFTENNVIDMEVHVGMGNAEYSGAVTGRLDAECGMGSIYMELTGSPKDHNYNMECAMGSIELDGENYSGIGSGMYIDNEADSEFSMECGMGSIELTFMDK